MLCPLLFNFSTTIGAFSHPMNLIDSCCIGPNNQPVDCEEKDNMRFLCVSEDGSPYRAQMNVLMTANDTLHPKLLKCKAYLHAMLPSLGPFHLKVKYVKEVFNIWSPFLKDCMQCYGRSSEKQWGYTLGFGRYDDTFHHVYLIEDALMFGALRAFINHNSEKTSDITKFGTWLASRNSKARTALLFMIYMEPFYLMNYATRTSDLDLFILGVLFTIQFDVATGEKDYALMKAYYIIRLSTLSQYWHEIFSAFFFTTNLNGKGVDLDLLCEYIHKNVKSRMRSVGHLPTFGARIQSLQVGLKNDVITKANDAYCSDSPRQIDKLMDYKAFQAKKVSTAELLKLADEFDQLKLWDDVQIELEVNRGSSVADELDNSGSGRNNSRKSKCTSSSGNRNSSSSTVASSSTSSSTSRSSSSTNSSSSSTTSRSSSSSDIEKPIFTSLIGNKTYSGKIGTIFDIGHDLIPVFLDGFSNAVVIGMEESEVLWENHMKCEVDLPADIQNEGGALGHDLAEGEHDDDNVDFIVDDLDEGINSDTTAYDKLKTKPSWKVGEISGAIITDIYGSSKKLHKLDKAVLKVIGSDREVLKLSQDIENVVKEAGTCQVLLIILHHYLDVYINLFQIYENLTVQSEYKSIINVHLNELGYMIDGLPARSDEELTLLRQINRLLGLKNPAKRDVWKAFMEFRAMIPKNIYDALKEEAVKILENIDTVVEEGTYENSWKPWSDRIITCTTIDDVNEEFKFFNESMKELTDMHKEYKMRSVMKIMMTLTKNIIMINVKN